MRPCGWLVAVILATGTAATALALNDREGNPQLAARQQGLLAPAAAALEQLLATTTDPRPSRVGRAREVHCAAGSQVGLGNPWRCIVRYPRPPWVRYRVSVHADGSIYGSGAVVGQRRGTPLSVRGCCVGTP